MTAVVSYPDPANGASRQKTIVLPYKTVDGKSLLDFKEAHLGEALSALADPRYPISELSFGIEGLFGKDVPQVSKLISLLGQPEEFKGRVSPSQKALLFADGNLCVNYKTFSDTTDILVTEIHVVGPKFRLKNGLGVGSTLGEFLEVYDPFFGMSQKKSSQPHPVTRDGVIKGCNVMILMHSARESALAVYVDTSERVRAITLLTENSQPQPHWKAKGK